MARLLALLLALLLTSSALASEWGAWDSDTEAFTEYACGGTEGCIKAPDSVGGYKIPQYSVSHTFTIGHIITGTGGRIPINVTTTTWFP